LVGQRWLFADAEDGRRFGKNDLITRFD
jgi:hypothetical protein